MANSNKLPKLHNGGGDGKFNFNNNTRIIITDTNIISMQQKPEFNYGIIYLLLHKKSNGNTKLIIETVKSNYQTDLIVEDTTIHLNDITRILCHNTVKSNWWNYYFSFPWHLVKGCFYSEK